MKNLKRKGWDRDVDEISVLYQYEKGEVMIYVVFYASDSSYVVSSADYSGFENDQREHYSGKFQNNAASINGILALAESVSHFTQSSVA